MYERGVDLAQKAATFATSEEGRAELRRRVPVASFVLGFAYDAWTRGPIDRIAAQLSLLVKLALLGALIAVWMRVAREPHRWPRVVRRANWLAHGEQFLFGGLFSAYVIYYFNSATWGPTLLFVVALVGLVVANRFSESHLRLDRVRIVLFTLTALSFFLFFVPVITGFPGPGLFLVAAILALGATASVAWFAFVDAGHGAKDVLPGKLVHPASAVGALAAVYAAGFVPPVPLALEEGGIFHDAVREGGRMTLVYENPPWYAPLRDDDRWYRFRPGDRVVCYSAIFAPEGMRVGVTHAWEHWQPGEGWTLVNAIPFQVSGGREHGYRGTTYKRNIAAGDWRVRVVTATGHELGRYAFTVDLGPWSEPAKLNTRLAH